VLMKSKEQCEPALAELRRYQAAVGPAAASEGPTLRLQRECEQILAANKQAEEAAREMKAEAEKQAAKKAAAPAQAPSATASAGKAPVTQPAGAAPAGQGRENPTK